MKLITIKRQSWIRPAAGMIGGFFLTANCHAETKPATDWFNGPNATGSWGGVRDTLNDRGVAINLSWLGNYYGLVSGGLDEKGIFDEEWAFKLSLDLAKLTGFGGLQGLKFETKVRYRDGDDINEFAGASNSFDPSNIQGGKHWRFREAYFTYKTPELFGIKDLFVITGGWQNPYFYFAAQPESKLFDNTAIVASKGLSMNGVPWSGTYAAWGGNIRVQPNDWFYAQVGGYGAIVGANARDNHGFNMDEGTSGAELLAEIGITPKIGSDKLPGKYAVGGVYWGVDNMTFDGSKREGRLSLYLQADQQLYREDGAEKNKDGGQGLNFFSIFVFADSDNNQVPFYFHTGFTYKGLIPGRDADQAGIAFGYANYSNDKAESEKLAGLSNHQEQEALIEAVYRVQVNKWAFVQPFAQYVFRPKGTGDIPDATLLGVQAGITF